VGVVPRDRELIGFRRVPLPWDDLALGRPPADPRHAFHPRVDVYYCGEREPRAVVRVELPGVDVERVTIEVHGRRLIIAGDRRTEADEYRLYQQVEIEGGPFRREIELGAEVTADHAEASYQDGILRVEIPLAQARPARARRVPVQSPTG
jgi:HSP20 family protein